jgi:hypothetical protein
MPTGKLSMFIIEFSRFPEGQNIPSSEKTNAKSYLQKLISSLYNLAVGNPITLK